MKFAGVDPLHCVYLAPEVEMPPRSQQRTQLEEPSAQAVRLETQQTQIRRARTPIPELDEAASEDLNLSPRHQLGARPNTSRTTIRPNCPPVVSLDSFSSLHLDPDSRSLRSDTIVARSGTSRSGTSRDHSIYAVPSEADMSSYPPDIAKWRHHHAVHHWDGGVGNEVMLESDPRRPLTNRDTNDTGGIFNYVNYSTSPSSDDEGQTYQFALPPSQPPPKKGLPPVPVRHEMRDYMPAQAPYSKYHQKPGQLADSHPSDEEIFTLQKQYGETGPVAATHPVRMSSLTREEKAIRERQREWERHKGYLNHDNHVRPLGSGRQSALSPMGRHVSEQERVYRHRM
jgi:hypothetical protein